MFANEKYMGLILCIVTLVQIVREFFDTQHFIELYVIVEVVSDIAFFTVDIVDIAHYFNLEFLSK